MAFTSSNPFDEMTSLREAVNRLMEESVVREPFGTKRQIMLDVYETADDLDIVAALPGVSPDDLNVTATGDTVTIKAKVPSETEQKESREWTWYLHEIPHGEFSRTIDLPVEVNPQQAKATFQDGLLKLELPKVEEARQHRLHVQTGGQHKEQPVNVGQQPTQQQHTNVGQRAGEGV
ncbi:MAG TPA: Hsp20/alpha crystallin family protein [Chloroflexota bacterium]|nr:Hsp20/alpha crystallin family protein [Chloroflexota bacterium]